jgi:hypothetical protein
MTAATDRAGVPAEHCADCGVPLAQPDELVSGLCLYHLNLPSFAADDAGTGYRVELGGQTYTQAQWEALQPYIDGCAYADSEDAATWTAGTDRTGATDAEFRNRIAAFEGADAAPESFDAIAALRRVEALLVEVERIREHNLRTFGVSSTVARVGVADVRAALAAPQTGQHATDGEAQQA